jgi:hypothetical protein
LQFPDPVTDESGGSAMFIIGLSGRSTSTVKVNYATQASSAGSSDFTAVSGTVAFAPGQRVTTVSVLILNDATSENTETFNLVLSSPVNATLPNKPGMIRIWSNDQAPVAIPSISAENSVANEGDGFAEFVVRLSSPSTQTVSAQYRTGDGSAIRISDFAEVYVQPLSFAPGETVKTVRVALVDDTTAESTESFYLRLATPTTGTIGTGSVTATILDND